MTTKEVAASDMFDFYSFPSSRQLYSLNQIAHALGDCDDELLCGWVADAIRLAEEAVELTIRFSGRRLKREFGPEARQADQDMDRALGALAKVLTASAQAYGETSSQAQLARYALDRLFPGGVRAMIHLPYMDEEIQVRMLLRRIEAEPRLRLALRELGAERFVEQVSAVHARYQEALRTEQQHPTYAQVKEARRAGQERLCQIVALVLVRLATGEHEGDHAAALRKALGEVKRQNAVIGSSFKRRARVTEVDPETGEELEPEDDEDAEVEADARFTGEDVAEASARVIEDRVADPWRPGAENGLKSDVA
ncbi:MAG: hypothetical protein R3F62_04480 [Planctomycetota bacterium]